MVNQQDISGGLSIKALALVCLLLLEPKQTLSRDYLLRQLWPDSGEDAARYNLRFHIWSIKKQVPVDSTGAEFLQVNKDWCGINPAYPVWADLLEVTAFAQSPPGDIPQLETLRGYLAGSFMGGCYFKDCNELNDLILFECRRCENQRIQILKALAEQYQEAKSPARCQEILLELTTIDPYDEEVALSLIQVYLANGKRSTAVLFYQELCNRFAQELGISVSDPLRDVFQESFPHTTQEGTPGEAMEETAQSFSPSLPQSLPVPGEKPLLSCHWYCLGEIPMDGLTQILLGYGAQVDLLDWALLPYQQRDLSYLYPPLLPQGQTLPQVSPPIPRITSGFMALIQSLATDYRLELVLTQQEAQDEISRLVCTALEAQNILTIQRTKEE